jgi:hypothetical protein
LIFVGKLSILSPKPLFCRSNQNVVGEKLAGNIAR